jgi:hypothetical protein
MGPPSVISTMRGLVRASGARWISMRTSRACDGGTSGPGPAVPANAVGIVPAAAAARTGMDRNTLRKCISSGRRELEAARLLERRDAVRERWMSLERAPEQRAEPGGLVQRALDEHVRNGPRRVTACRARAPRTPSRRRPGSGRSPFAAGAGRRCSPSPSRRRSAAGRGGCRRTRPGRRARPRPRSGRSREPRW